jgi:DNA-binding response OmpR family regulator
VSDPGRILLADDEETFLHATADILRREGYRCDCAPDARVAAEMLRGNEYELLIADIKMPGNPELELIKSLPRLAEGLPVILVTGYPSIRSATESIQLPVVAYLVKPIEIAELLAHIPPAIERYRLLRKVRESRARIEQLCRDLGGLETVVERPGAVDPTVSSAEFLDLCIQNIVNTVADVRHISLAAQGQDPGSGPCHLLGCPNLEHLTEALEETIGVLRETKGSFKSKALGDLRKKLELVLARGHEIAPEAGPTSGA